MNAKKEKRFEWSDAWVFAAMRGAAGDTGVVDFSSLLAIGDLLNHAILTDTEIREAMRKFYQYGLVEIVGEKIKRTGVTDELYSRAEKKRGGLFSVVDNCLSVLNSPRTKLTLVNDDDVNVEFIDREFVLDAYQKYLHRRKTQ